MRAVMGAPRIGISRRQVSMPACFPDHEERSDIGSHARSVSASMRPLFDADNSYVFLFYWILPAPDDPNRLRRLAHSFARAAAESQ